MSESTSPVSAGRLLMADDEEIFLLSTADLLRREGFVVDCVRDASGALDRLGRIRYDVFISDISMPGNPNLEILRTIPELNTGLPVILVTGYPSGPTAIQAIGLSVLSYLVKPVEFDELLKHVRRGLEFRGLQNAVQASSQRIQAWAQEMESLVGQLQASSPLSLNQVVGIMMGRMGETLLDLKRLVDLGPGSLDPCSIQNCPRLAMYEQVMREGIDTLERTKGAFKSRELGDLRQKLEQTVERR